MKYIPTIFHLNKYAISDTIEQVKILKNHIKLIPVDQEPWVPLQFIGCFPIWAHWKDDSTDFWGFSELDGFKVLLNKEDYHDLLTRYQELLSEDLDATLLLEPRVGKDIESFKKYIIKNNLWKADRHLCKCDEINVSTSFEVDEDNKMAMEALIHGYNLYPIYGLKVSDFEKNVFPQDFKVDSKILPIFEDKSQIYILIDHPEKTQQIEDCLNCEYLLPEYKSLIPFYASKVIQERIMDSSEVLESDSFTGSSHFKEDSKKTRIFICDDYDTRNPSEEAILDNPRLALAYILKHAIKLKASDIHIQSSTDSTNIRFRINTFLSNKATFPKLFLPKLNSIITQYSNIDTFKKLMPHSGRFTAIYNEKPYEVRVSLIPNKDEQSCVLRIHDNNSGVKHLNELGLNYKDRIILEEAITRRSGIILITGPTGSGKSTTLYATLMALNKEDISLETIEDPVERPIDGIKQFQVRYNNDEDKNLTFPKLFREVLRHDPDVIMVGEIRDIETANLAISASQTGHLVLSTLHTQDALGSIPRLISEGLDPQRLADSLILLQAQRLIGILCKHCKIKINQDSENAQLILQEFQKNDIIYNVQDPELYCAGSCEHCHQTGYDGMQAIYELFPITDDIRECIANRKTIHEIKSFSNSVGYRSLYQEALQKIAQGKTSYEEAKKHKRQYAIDFNKLLEESQNVVKNEL